ncbi:MAG: Xanthine and CO dehydrogenases maturation factor, XdhC/CoxF family [uncultured Adhaeribacter sp.]|uniref:Xanthine and CO dehydrogenases maturation factor, XdhC/CoxF family n=1 Tax=uncultured Adhaeribacter sp. TaxID=448109 RepID=A0A6J4JQK2_9BACT|nr:MAG: Xanthine and CO dehydrogenases maturation factor, XdhC/CoxF family [uncultured Adhaeribacter sp.]
MKELQEIVRAYGEAQKANKQIALATVVQVEGSSYRQPGARMLVTDDGQLTGAISGGCLEGDALRKARLVMTQQKALLITYDTTDDDDAKQGVGLGCNGIIQILIEPIRPEDPNNPIALISRIISRRQNAVLVTVFSLKHRQANQPGTSLLLTPDETTFSQTLSPDFQDQILTQAQRVQEQQTSEIIKNIPLDGLEYTVFVEFVPPAISLVVIGAGNDAGPLVQMAQMLGWQITVIDGRANYATSARFPAANRVLIAKPDQALAQIPVDEQTVFVLLTHNYNYDLAMLRQLKELPLCYIGVLGPKKKLDRMLTELEETGSPVSAEQLARIYGPVGLNIGAETAEEIALATLAEIKAVFSRKEGGFLRDSTQAIHERYAVKTADQVASNTLPDIVQL